VLIVSPYFTDDQHLKFVPELSTSIYNETTTPIPG